MKTPRFFATGLALAILSTLNAQRSTLFAQGTAFTYQGVLNDQGAPAHGVYDLQFNLFAGPTGGGPIGPLAATNDIAISNGLFTVTLDFGADLFSGTPRWLGIGVRTNGSGAFTPVLPRQSITASPYAIFSSGAASMSNGVVRNPAFIGTVNNAPLDLFANNQRALRLVATPNSVNVIEGLTGNSVAAGVEGATIGGGGIGGGINRVAADFGTIGGGYANLTSNRQATVSGGGYNVAGGVSSTVGGGFENRALQNDATVAGGFTNTAAGFRSTVGGGAFNAATHQYAVVAGGNGNVASGDTSAVGGGAFNVAPGFAATIGGGYQNFANGLQSTIGGGQGNLANNANVTIGGGGQNVAIGLTATIGGGFQNHALQTDATIGGGYTNVASAYRSTIAGGALNRISSEAEYGTIGGGRDNLVTGTNAVIGGGIGNIVSGYGAVIAGGTTNRALSRFATISGGIQSYISDSASYSVVGGGGAHTVSAFVGTVGGGWAHSVQGRYGTIAGGFNNFVNGEFSTVAGGEHVRALADYSTVSGGGDNGSTNDQATVAGGRFNVAGGISSTVSGGYQNSALNTDATVSGGYLNVASGYRSTVPGGTANSASADYSFAAGRRAKADDLGSFVWADSSDVDFRSGTTNQFAVRCTGGARFVTAIDGTGAQTAGVRLFAGDTSWSSISDRNAKKNFAPANREAVLEKLASMPVQCWNYKWESDTNTPHLGPMAQDFKAAFYPGRDDKSISTLEFDGVALAAIQGLNEKVEARSERAEVRTRELEQRLEQKETEITELKQTVNELKRGDAENAKLKVRLTVLEKLITNLGSKGN